MGIAEHCDAKKLGRLSFIGHSLGGVIIRAALPHLKEFSEYMYSFMTFSSPHLGFLYNSSKLINTGMWVLKKWTKTKCLDQLTLSDAESIEDTYIFKLSAAPGLNWFKNIAFVSSWQDTYAPFDSARIQVGKKALKDQA